MNLIAEGVWVARKVRARQGDHPGVTVDTENLPGTPVTGKAKQFGPITSVATFSNSAQRVNVAAARRNTGPKQGGGS